MYIFISINLYVNICFSNIMHNIWYQKRLIQTSNCYPRKLTLFIRYFDRDTCSGIYRDSGICSDISVYTEIHPRQNTWGKIFI